MAIDKAVDSAQLEADLTSVADKIRAKAVITEKLAFPEGFNSALDEIVSVYEAPTQTKSVTITENGLYPIMPDEEYFAMNFVGLTVNCPSPDDAFAEVEYLLSDGYKNYSDYFYYKTWMEEVPYQLIRNVSNGEDFSFMFRSNSNLKRVPPLNTVNGKDFDYMFTDCIALETIEGIDFSNATSSLWRTFVRCDELKNLTVNGIIKKEIDFSYCEKLTHESLMSIINALFDWVADGQSPYIEIGLGSTNLEKLTDDEKNIVTSKGWILN